MEKNEESIAKELKDKQLNAIVEQAGKLAREFVVKIVESSDFKVNCQHTTNLKYDFEHDKEKFIKTLSRDILFEFLRGVPEEKEFIINSSSYCFDCGKYVNYKLTSNSLTPVIFDNNNEPLADDSECFKNGVFSVEIAVPSGRLILVDWPVHGKETLSYLDDYNNESMESINSAKGRFNRSNKYSKENVMHFSVGNSSPSVYYKDDVVYIGRNGYNKNDDEILLVEDAEDVGSICTDLWWVTAFDYEVYKKLVICKIGEENDIDKEYGEHGYGTAQVNVKPGIYRCTHYYETLNSDSDDPQLYTKMEWIKEI